MKVLHELCPGFRRRGFVVADPKIEGDFSPGLDLVFDEIIPRLLVVVGKVSRLSLTALFFDEILIWAINGAQVSQVPVKSHIVLERIRRDGEHDYVTAIARSAGDLAVPSLGGVLGICSAGDRKRA